MNKIKKRSKGITIFCWILIFYSSLNILWTLYVLVVTQSHLPLLYFSKIIYNFNKILFLNFYAMLMAILLFRLNNVARKLFIISAIILTILTINASINFSRQHTPKLIEKFNQDRIEQYKQKRETPPPVPAPLSFFALSSIFNLPRIIWIIIYAGGIILFTRPRIKEQFNNK